MSTTAENLVAPILSDVAETAKILRLDADSHTAIERFLDTLWVRYGLSSETLNAYRADLQSLNHWLDLIKYKTLLQASSNDLREFLAERAQRGPQSISPMPSLSCIKRFYRHLIDVNVRNDDPMEHVFIRAPRLVRHDLAVIETVALCNNKVRVD
jgi:integrase/recombinase XerD